MQYKKYTADLIHLQAKRTGVRSGHLSITTSCVISQQFDALDEQNSVLKASSLRQASLIEAETGNGEH